MNARSLIAAGALAVLAAGAAVPATKAAAQGAQVIVVDQKAESAPPAPTQDSGKSLTQEISQARFQAALARMHHASGVFRGFHRGERERVAMYRSRGGGSRRRSR